MLVCTLVLRRIAMYPMRSVLAASALSLVAFTLSAGPAHAQAGGPKNGKLVVPIKNSKGEDAGTATLKEEKGGKKAFVRLKLTNIPIGEHTGHIHAKPG